jgi:Zn-dependent metalloprotease
MSRSPLLAAAIAAALLAPAASAAVSATADARGQDLLRSHASQVRAAAADRFQALDAIVDADGTEHLRYARTHAGLPVIGGDLVLHSRAGVLQSTSVALRGPLKLDLRPLVHADEALVLASAAFGQPVASHSSAQLVVYARGATPQLAWQLSLRGGESEERLFVDAQDGRVLDRWSERETTAATGTGRTLYSGNVSLSTNSIAGGFELRDTTRGGGYTIFAGTGKTSGQIYKDADNSWGDGTVADGASAAADAQFGVASTWDYYKLVHNRSGIAGDGKGASNRVHYGRKYGNAYWNDGCFCMTYGDGDGVQIGPLVALDIAGHEMSHGVMSRTAGLVYSGESGGLNEANSDIMGSMVEFRANSTLDTPDYLIGEEIVIANVSGSANQTALRYMFDPQRDGASKNCWYSGIGSIDVHYSSGVANHFYYLLAEGTGAHTYSGVDHHSTTCNATSIAGIGRAKAEKIWYRAVSVYMTSTTDYAGARAATLSAASDLYGAASAERAAVAAAWSAVSVN